MDASTTANRHHKEQPREVPPTTASHRHIQPLRLQQNGRSITNSIEDNKDILEVIAFFKNLLTAENASHDSTSHDLSEIEGRLEEVEAEFSQSNSPSTILYENDDSESSSVCEHCACKNELQGQREAVNDEWKVYENPTMLYEVMLSPSEIFHKAAMPSSEMFEEVVQPSEMIHKAAMPPSCVEEAIEVLFDCDREQSGGDKKQGRRWWRVLTVLVTVIVVSTVGVSSYINNNEDEGFLTLT
ncbi:hypothetical protein L2E82_14500 [Cichorium intybus]|uniref:Uncharacterized protein n=1 Tax=Cichorium intybus TaxID=13427 RepID=A0ACB9F0J2_CICIN|nr:hypothetical protein L2E82_14500 [Cichorium intybus]